jgi:RNA polymerase sigma factor (TIGR02999 family)
MPVPSANTGTDGPEVSRAASAQAAYALLRRIAFSRLARVPRRASLQATDVVHEAYVRLLESQTASERPLGFDGAAGPHDHRDLSLFAAAIRSVLVDRIRRREVRRRHAPAVAAGLEAESSPRSHLRSLLALDESLDVLAKIDERAARLVELHVFGGLSLAHAAPLLGVSEPTAERDWRFAKAWLADRMGARRSPNPENHDGSDPAAA